MKHLVSRERVLELLDYCEESGTFTWKKSRGRVKAGDKAGSVGTHRGCPSYLSISLDGRCYRAHHLAWLWVHGRWPKDQLDHIDTDKLNNRIANLREACTAENQQNQRKAHRNNRSGLLGATLHRNKFWRAQIAVNGKAKHLGYFDTPEAAHEAYVSAKRAMHPMGML